MGRFLSVRIGWRAHSSTENVAHPSPPCRLPCLQGHSRFPPDENRHAESHYREGTERDFERMPRENQGDRIIQVSK